MPTTPWLNLLSFLGLFAFCGIAWLTSENRRVIPWHTIAWGLGLQLLLGLFVFVIPGTRDLIVLFSDGINAILDATEAGARFVFGSLLVPDPSSTRVPGPLLAGRWIARAVSPAYVPVPGDRLSPDNLNLGYIFAFRALPSVIFFSALMALLYALGLIQPVVNLFARLFRRSMRLSGAEALSGAANIFVGIEALIVVRPYLARMTRSELCAILASCFGSIASTVLALYASLLRPVFPNITGHLVSASIMAIPACFVMAKILVPETERPETLGLTLVETRQPELRADPAVADSSPPDSLPPENLPPDHPPLADAVPSEPMALEAPSQAFTQTAEITPVAEASVADVALHPEPTRSEAESIGVMESVIVGALDGVKLAVAIAALLIAVLGLVAIINLFFANLASLAQSSNAIIRGIGQVFQVITLENLMGALFLPLTFLTGVSLNWQELWQASLLIGQRVLTTEVPSYQQLAALSADGLINRRGLLVVSYALCGFAHIPSLGIFVGGLVGLVPSRRRDIVNLAWRALWAATLATLMIGAIAGLYDFGNPSIIGQ